MHLQFASRLIDLDILQHEGCFAVKKIEIIAPLTRRITASPTLLGPVSTRALQAVCRSLASAWTFAPQVEASLAVQPIYTLMVGLTAATARKSARTTAKPDGRNLFDPSKERRIIII
ncbi:hypothetical protein [Xanthomonas sp. NCPPB 1754]|uniref:hypothetical protein n=1 Tax=Xanthomonas sp. NCPPB 1754 TaxID=487536 RepID=UPI0035561549